MSSNDPVESYVTFIEYDEPALQAGRYEIEVKQAIQIDGVDVSPGVPDASLLFSVTGKRFVFDAADIDSVFPTDLADGEFSGILPHIIFNRGTLPWERAPGGSVASNAPWLAILLLNDDEMTEVTVCNKKTAANLVNPPTYLSIYNAQGVSESTTTQGSLPDNGLSYPDMAQLDYGEFLNTVFTTIDIPVDLFNKIAPSLNDLSYLAHARKVDTMNSEDSSEQTLQKSIVIGNRISKSGTNSHLFLVSLENMGTYLPSDDGTNKNIPVDKDFVRLIVYRSWKFFANAGDQVLESLLENLVPKKDAPGVSSLQYYLGKAPNEEDLRLALDNQVSGTLTDKNAQDLLYNAFSLGYIPLPHHMRHGGDSVSWYRGPLLPLLLPNGGFSHFSCADEANRYNPQTGMFDVSYGAAWQLGQLLALQNASFATALYNWKKAVSESDAMAEEQSLLQQKLLGTSSLDGVLNQRKAQLQAAIPVPDEIVNWIAKLRLLEGVPFNYLVPHEGMLPLESMRFFYLDFDWVDALVNGAFSIGSTNEADCQKDAHLLSSIRETVTQRIKKLRPNPHPAGSSNQTDDPEVITGLLLRSKAVSGWPRLIINGYEADDVHKTACVKYKMTRLAPDVLICFFEGNVATVDIHEPPEQLHFGMEEIDGHPGTFTTGLRVLTPNTYPPNDPPASQLNPGQQLPDLPDKPILVITTRSDLQTVQVANAANAICNTLNTNYNQGLTLGANFTAAEFAIEMVKGVAQVEFQLKSNLVRNVSPSNKERFSYANKR